ncbi:MAG: cytochrome o ubiquinol oxidase subunit IV [Oligoflexia bacterium]|nr:cytochrome o ubiquinol oxidase subunit IV [Oligoflexia bacterium]MBF0366382.1 cytochrome o ubiquinol oxidase subunit IV [Oligoflexia bacterium]
MSTKPQQQHCHMSLASYAIGFFLSIVLTLVPYKLVVTHPFNKDMLVTAVVLCALVQLFVQLKFFLHLNFSPKGRDSLLSFIFTAIMVLIIVFGSLWIMHDLNYYMMDPIMEQHHQAME